MIIVEGTINLAFYKDVVFGLVVTINFVDMYTN